MKTDKSKVAVGNWNKLNRRVRHKQQNQAVQTVWNRLRKSIPDVTWEREVEVVNGLHVDFYCRAANFAVEVDGLYHGRQSYLSNSRRSRKVEEVPAQGELDGKRDERLGNVDVEVYRLRTDQTTSPEILGWHIDKIRKRIVERLTKFFATLYISETNTDSCASIGPENE